MEETTLEALVKEERAAELLNVSVRKMQNWRYYGDGPSYVSFGRTIRYRKKDLEEFVLRQRNPVETGPR